MPSRECMPAETRFGISHWEPTEEIQGEGSARMLRAGCRDKKQLLDACACGWQGGLSSPKRDTPPWPRAPLGPARRPSCQHPLSPPPLPQLSKRLSRTRTLEMSFSPTAIFKGCSVLPNSIPPLALFLKNQDLSDFQNSEKAKLSNSTLVELRRSQSYQYETCQN